MNNKISFQNSIIQDFQILDEGVKVTFSQVSYQDIVELNVLFLKLGKDDWDGLIDFLRKHKGKIVHDVYFLHEPPEKYHVLLIVDEGSTKVDYKFICREIHSKYFEWFDVRSVTNN